MKEMTYTEEAEPINPDEVRLRINSVIENRLAQSWADLNINDRAEYMTKPEEVWADEGINDDAELGNVEHFPEGDNGKPVEVWPDEDEFLDGEEDEDFMREYSPEPGVVYNDRTEEDVNDEDTKDGASSLRDSPNGKEVVEDVPVKEVNNEGSLSDRSLPSEDEHADNPSNSERELYNDPNLGYDINDNKLPDVKDKDMPESPAVTDTESKTENNEKDMFTKDGLTNRKNRRPLLKGLNETSGESGADFTLTQNNTDEVESVSALERLKIIAKEQDLFPSGPPRFGPPFTEKRRSRESRKKCRRTSLRTYRLWTGSSST